MSLVPHQDAAITFGQSNITGDDITPPRVKILQLQSQEVADLKGEVGDFYDTLRGVSYGPSLRFIPLTNFQNRILLVRSERLAAINDKLTSVGLEKLGDTETGLVCRSLDMVMGRGYPGIECSTCPLSQWDGQVPPLCSETRNVTALTEVGDLIILSFTRSSAKVGKKLLTMLRLNLRTKPWASIYEATTQQVRGAKGNFHVPEITKTSDVPAPELMAQAEEWAKQLGGIVIDVTPIDEEDEGTIREPVADTDAAF